MSKIYSVQDLTYEINNRKIIEEVTCSIEEGITVIKGPNGAGKTTFLKLLFGMIHPTTGNIVRHFNSKNMEISFVFQEPIFLNRSVEDNLKHLLYCKSIKKKYWMKTIHHIVSEYSLEHLLKSQIRDLSGGELQLLSLIRSMITKPSILLYDEPTNNLDDDNIELVTKIIKDINNQGLSLIMVSHNSILNNITRYNQFFIKNGSLINE